MNVSDLISHLTEFARQSPENGHAEVMLQFFDDICYGLAGANNAKTMTGHHMLIIVPDVNMKIGVKQLRIQ